MHVSCEMLSCVLWAPRMWTGSRSSCPELAYIFLSDLRCRALNLHRAIKIGLRSDFHADQDHRRGRSLPELWEHGRNCLVVPCVTRHVLGGGVICAQLGQICARTFRVNLCQRRNTGLNCKALSVGSWAVLGPVIYPSK